MSPNVCRKCMLSRKNFIYPNNATKLSCRKDLERFLMVFLQLFGHKDIAKDLYRIKCWNLYIAA